MKKKLLSLLIVAAISISCTGCAGILSKFTGPSDKTVITRGSWAEDVYTSEFFDVKVALPQDWTIISDEEIAATFGVEIKDMSADTDFSKVSAIYDMAMVDLSKGINIIVMAENLSLVLGGTSITDEGYLGNVSTMLEDQDFIIGEISDVQIGGYTFKKLEVTHTSGVCQEYFVRRIGNYMMAIIGSFSSDYAESYNAALNSIEQNQ